MTKHPSQPTTTLFYAHDPMCSWCWAFNPCWQELQTKLDDSINIRYLAGGLAPDSEQLMPLALQNTIQSYWRTIEQKVPGTRFNYAFWQQCQPRRSTYPACRAVIAATNIDPNQQSAMILGIQTAYYTQAKNPSDEHVLADIAEQIGLDRQMFIRVLHSAATQQRLVEDIQLSRNLGMAGFPSLCLDTGSVTNHIMIDYQDSNTMLKSIHEILASC